MTAPETPKQPTQNTSSEKGKALRNARRIKIAAILAGAAGGTSLIFGAVAAGEAIAHSNAQTVAAAGQASYEVQKTFYDQAQTDRKAAIGFGSMALALGGLMVATRLIAGTYSQNGGSGEAITQATTQAQLPPQPPTPETQQQ